MDRYAPYVEWLSSAHRVLDVRCGEGAFLQLLQQRGITAVGIDDDENLVRAAGNAGLEASLDQPRNFLTHHPDEFDGIFLPRVEQFGPQDCVDLIYLAYKALQPRGRLLIAGSSPRNLSLQLHGAWSDLDHVRFYTPEIIRWIARDAGLRMIDVGDNPKLVVAAQAPDPNSAPAARRSLRSRLRQRLAEWLTPESLLARMQAAEDAIRGFYPPAEFFVTGIR